MILPIVAYGDPVLRVKANDIKQDFEGLSDLILDMYQTMYEAHGVGLAAPQIGRPIRLFVVDTAPFANDDELSEGEQEFLKNFKQTFINAKVVDESGEEWSFNEGCLSIPDVREDVKRKSKVTVSFYDENFIHHTKTFDGLVARVIQHEYDHIEGVLFTDKLSSLKKRLIKSRLTNISKGNIVVDYKMRFPNKSKKR